MKRTIPAGRIAIATWIVAAVIISAAMTVCSSCGAVPSNASQASCAARR